jgi:RNA polymerase sigma factor (TIGR02999 family)
VEVDEGRASRRPRGALSATIIDREEAMSTQPRDDLTLLLRRAGEGDPDAANAAFEAVYGELRCNARSLMRSQPVHHTLDAEGLLHEAYIKVSRNGKADWKSRSHFLAVMSCAMRQYLIDHANAKRRLKRGGDHDRVPLTGILLPFENRTVDLLSLHEALASLEKMDADAARTIELTYFVGLEAKEVAQATGQSVRTVQRDLKFGRTWVLGELSR